MQAAIVAVHTEAPTAEDTDWPQILALYDLLLAAHPNPVTALNRAVAVGEVHGPAAGLAAVAALADDPRLGHRLDAVRGHFLARAGDTSAAADAYARAAAAAPQAAERRHLATRAQNLKETLTGLTLLSSRRREAPSAAAREPKGAWPL